jgi:hypothetical protein
MNKEIITHPDKIAPAAVPEKERKKELVPKKWPEKTPMPKPKA